MSGGHGRERPTVTRGEGPSTADDVPASSEETDSGDVVGDSVVVGSWTIVSRLTGVGRVGAIAAVLGPTYLGNTFQATNTLPNLTYEFLTGTLFVSLLVPPLVQHVDRSDRRAAERLAGGFLGVVMVAFVAVTLVAVIAGPLLLRLLTLGVDSSAVAADQRRVGWQLLALLMPQLMLYGVAGTGTAVMNAHGRFALAAAAPALENIGVMLTLGVTAVLYGTDVDLADVTGEQVLLLGVGTTAAVGLHAAAVWWGARRLGVRMIPRAGWRDPEVREVLRRAVPSLGYAWLNATRSFAVLVVANGVRGGVVAFQLAMNFFYLPVAVGAKPVATALLPRLSRLHRDRKRQMFRDELVQGAALMFFLTVPAAVAFVILAMPLAEAVSMGAMATLTGETLIAASLASLAVGVLGESGFILGTHACYARNDVRSPFMATLTRTGISAIFMAVAFAFMDGTAVVVVLGIAVSAGNVGSAVQLAYRVRSGLPASGERLAPSLARALGASLLMAGPAYVVAAHPPTWISDQVSEVAAVGAAVVVGMGVFIAIERALRSPELASLMSGLKGLRAGSS